MSRTPLLLLLLVAIAYADDQCTMSDFQKSDCGYVGVNQD